MKTKRPAKSATDKPKVSAKPKRTTSLAKRSSPPKRKRTSARAKTSDPTPIAIVTQNPRQLPPPPVQDLTPAMVDPPTTAVASDRGATPVRFGDTPLAAAFRFVEPTWRNYIMYVDMEARTGNLDAQRYLATWQSLPPRERNAHVPEQLCDLASVSHADLIRWVSGQVWLEGSAKSAMCMSFMRDKVLEKTAQYAIDSPDNYRHADLFMRTSGLLPTPAGRAGAAVSIFNVPVASSSSVALAGSKSESSPVAVSGLHDMDSEIVELSRIMQLDSDPAKCAAELRRNDPDDDEDDDEDEEE